MTGAMLPLGCDAVVPLEEFAVNAGIARLKDGAAVKPGTMCIGAAPIHDKARCCWKRAHV